jgi:hypothetical protein
LDTRNFPPQNLLAVSPHSNRKRTLDRRDTHQNTDQHNLHDPQLAPTVSLHPDVHPDVLAELLYAGDEVVSEVVRAPRRVVDGWTDILIGKGVEEKLQDHQTADGRNEGVQEKEL